MKPILFNTEMVQAILDGRKTQTRRIAKTIRSFELKQNNQVFARVQTNKFTSFGGGAMSLFLEKFAPYQIGDILYVRETWRNGAGRGTSAYQYKADMTKKELREEECKPGWKPDILKWHPSIHMPKAAARIFLKVTNIRVQWIQDITEDEAKTEGCIDFKDKIGDGKFEDVLEFDLTARDAFAELWDSTTTRIGQYGWDTNPYVWVIEFERTEKPC